MYTREASHAGSWYDSNGNHLGRQLSQWINAVDLSAPSSGKVRALIGPHAGYSFSGPTAAFAYKFMEKDSIRRVFLLGPSHHVYLPGCGLFHKAKKAATPVGDLSIDEDIVRELAATGKFQRMDRSVDEDEHSIEMHLPYVAKTLGDRIADVKIVPILVGGLNVTKEEEYGNLLAPYLENEENFFIISSDFCHWGPRFRYQKYEPDYGAIHEFIEHLDMEGIKLIENQDADGFATYLKSTSNTICGRHPIAVFLRAMAASTPTFTVRLTKYAQSNAATTLHDSSVSYASFIISSE